jgi:two-component system, response regulator RegA
VVRVLAKATIGRSVGSNCICRNEDYKKQQRIKVDRTRVQPNSDVLIPVVVLQRFAAELRHAPLEAPRYIGYTVSMGESRSLHNVLVVDDDERILGSWKRAARERNVFTASDASTARQLASTERPDLAIVDLRLGNSSGIDLIRELKRELPHLLVVLCSGYLSVAAAVAAVRAGADVVVFKPITFREILQRIEESEEEPDLEDTPTLARAEWEHIMRVLADCNGNVSMAARRLGIYRSSLQRRLRKYAPRS